MGMVGCFWGMGVVRSAVMLVVLQMLGAVALGGVLFWFSLCSLRSWEFGDGIWKFCLAFWFGTAGIMKVVGARRAPRFSVLDKRCRLSATVSPSTAI